MWYNTHNGREFQSTLPARGATYVRRRTMFAFIISIHAPREGSDKMISMLLCERGDFNPRSPRGERREPRQKRRRQPDFNPRSPRGERRWQIKRTLIMIDISIHAPREGSDNYDVVAQSDTEISIHAPREGSDATFAPLTASVVIFQSTLPARGATQLDELEKKAQTIFQSTLPARGATQRLPPRMSTSKYFNPRSPRGERRAPFQQEIFLHFISIHAPREGSDFVGVIADKPNILISIHAPREGSD